MRPMKPKDAVRAVQVTSRMPFVHGAPIHFGDPEAIGIKDISKPDFGDASLIKPGEVPVFWACGVTPQSSCHGSQTRIHDYPCARSHVISDVPNADLSVL
jgi:uncharacterized protein YcsI (UPF0317 family)